MPGTNKRFDVCFLLYKEVLGSTPGASRHPRQRGIRSLRTLCASAWNLSASRATNFPPLEGVVRRRRTGGGPSLMKDNSRYALVMLSTWSGIVFTYKLEPFRFNTSIRRKAGNKQYIKNSKRSFHRSRFTGDASPPRNLINKRTQKFPTALYCSFWCRL